MFNHVRKLLFLIILGLLITAGYRIYSNYSLLANIPVKVKISKNGADIQIEKFKVKHEVSGYKDWELQADHAEIDNLSNLTRMTNVRMEFQQSRDQTYQISAEKGVLDNHTKDFQLEGHVKLVAQPESLIENLNSQNNKPYKRSSIRTD